MALAKIGKKHQITIPLKAREKSSIAPGDILVLQVNDDILTLSKVAEIGSEKYYVTIRNRYQITLPAKICKHLGVAESDFLDVQGEDDGVRILVNRCSSASPTKLESSKIEPVHRAFHSPLLDAISRKSPRRKTKKITKA